MKSIAIRIKKHIKESFESDDFPLMFIAGVAVGTVVMLYIAKFGGHLSNDHTRWAEFGSYVGGVLGATFAFLAFLILLQTLKVNQKELSDTRQVLEKQNSLIHQQSFEFTFFELLRLLKLEGDGLQTNAYTRHKEFGNTLRFEQNESNVARGVYWDMCDVAYHLYVKHNRTPAREDLMEWYEKIRSCNHVQIDQYTKPFHAMLTFLTESNLFKEEKLKYFNIVVAHTHYYALLVDICQALYEQKHNPEFIELLLTFNVIDHIDRQDQFSFWLQNSLKEL